MTNQKNSSKSDSTSTKGGAAVSGDKGKEVSAKGGKVSHDQDDMKSSESRDGAQKRTDSSKNGDSKNHAGGGKSSHKAS